MSDTYRCDVLTIRRNVTAMRCDLAVIRHIMRTLLVGQAIIGAMTFAARALGDVH